LAVRRSPRASAFLGDDGPLWVDLRPSTDQTEIGHNGTLRSTLNTARSIPIDVIDPSPNGATDSIKSIALERAVHRRAFDRATAQAPLIHVKPSKRNDAKII